MKRPRRRRRVLRTIGIVAIVVLIPIGWSYGHALTAPGSQGWQVRSVEWLRDHGMGGVVDYAEATWLRLHPPRRGGRPRSLPHLARESNTGPTPPAVPTPATARLPGEGTWIPAGPVVNGRTTMYTTFVRPDAVHTSFVVGLARLDPHAVRLQLIPGTTQPGGGWPATGTVPSAEQPRLLAAFNSGFKIDESSGGFYLGGRTARPLAPGIAALAIRRDGTATVGQWGRDLTDVRDYAAVRQNLPLIVDGGKVVDGSHSPEKTWRGLLTWRSGVGVDRTGALIYAGGDSLDLQSLADVLRRAGAVRAMELDIHPHSVTFNLFRHPRDGRPIGEKLVPSMTESADRYLTVDQRDFFAVLAR